MAHSASYIVGYRRKRQGKTDYHKRLDLLKSGKLRLVVRPSNKHILVQLVKYEVEGDQIINQAHSSILKKYGWSNSTSNVPAAYLTGLICGLTSQGEKAILDIGLKDSVKASRIYSAVNGAIDGGLDVSCGSEILPDSSRVKGEHIPNNKVREEFDIVREKIIGSLTK